MPLILPCISISVRGKQCLLAFILLVFLSVDISSLSCLDMYELNCTWVFDGWFVRLPKYTMIDALHEQDMSKTLRAISGNLELYRKGGIHNRKSMCSFKYRNLFLFFIY